MRARMRDVASREHVLVKVNKNLLFWALELEANHIYVGLEKTYEIGVRKYSNKMNIRDKRRATVRIIVRAFAAARAYPIKSIRVCLLVFAFKLGAAIKLNTDVNLQQDLQTIAELHQ